MRRDGRGLGPKWKGWQLKAGSIVDPDGNETSAVQLHNYALIVQYTRHLAGEHGEGARTEFYKLLGQTPRYPSAAHAGDFAHSRPQGSRVKTLSHRRCTVAVVAHRQAA
jgi:hypothetical protein